MRSELGVTFRSESKTPDLMREVASRHGFGMDMLGVYDDLGDMNPVFPLIAAAEALPKRSETRLGPVGFAVPKHASMVDVVGHMTALHNLRPDKVFLGMVPGAWMDATGLKPATVSDMREAVESAQYLLGKRSEGYSGKRFPIAPGFRLNYETPKHMPILIGAYGPKLAGLAGEVANEIKVGGSANPLLVPIIRDRVREGASRIGRDPNEVGIVFGAVSMIDEDRNRALAAAKEKALLYINVVGDKDPTIVRDYPEELANIKKYMKAGDSAQALRYLPEGLARRFTFAGSANDIISQTEELFAAGVSRVEFGTPHSVADELGGVKLLVERVFPHFRRK